MLVQDGCDFIKEGLWSDLSTRYALFAATSVLGSILIGLALMALHMSQLIPEVVNMGRVTVLGVIGVICVVSSIYLWKSICLYNKRIKECSTCTTTVNGIDAS